MNIEMALGLFLDALRAEDFAPKTVDTYGGHLRRFIRWLPADRRSVGEIRTSDLTAWINSERSRGMSKATVYGEYRALSRFFAWCSASEEVGRPRSPLKNSSGERVFNVKKPPKQPPRRAELKTIDALIAAIPRGHWIQLRNRALLRLLRDTGLRVGEASNICMEDLDLAGRVLLVRESKSRRPRAVRLHTATAEAIQAYLLCRPPCPSDLARYLFVGSKNGDPDHGTNGKRWSEYAIWLMIKKLCERTGLPHVNPHSIRHLFGTKAINDGIRLEVVSDLMGHHDPTFTRKVYADLLPETARREYDENWT